MYFVNGKKVQNKTKQREVQRPEIKTALCHYEIAQKTTFLSKLKTKGHSAFQKAYAKMFF